MTNEFNDTIIFLDENNEKKSMLVDITIIDSGFVTFKNFSGSLITIPVNRVLKIKRKDDESAN